MYLANLYRGWRGSPASFLSGTTSAASRHHRPSSPASCLLRTLGRGRSFRGCQTWKPLGPLLPSSPPSSPLPPRLGPRPTLCFPILIVPPHPRATSGRKPWLQTASPPDPKPLQARHKEAPSPGSLTIAGAVRAGKRKCGSARPRDSWPFRERRSRSPRQHFRGGPFRSGPGRNSRATFGSPGRFHTRNAGTCRRPGVTKTPSSSLGSPYIFCQRPWFLWPWL